jgi:hypothetical protein
MPYRTSEKHKRLSAQQAQELAYRQPGIGDDPSKRALANLRVIRHDNARMEGVASEDHVAACLAAKPKARTFERTTDLPARKVGR